MAIANMAAAQIAIRFGLKGTVSYTHLDVYKRQAEYSTGAGKNYKKPEIHDENIVLVAQRPVKEMRKLKLFR